jgi:sulfite reductase alpha subunit-like flavoprotein
MLRSTPQITQKKPLIIKENSSEATKTELIENIEIVKTDQAALTIVYATQTGTSKVYADQLAASANAQGLQVGALSS